jgi:dATP pyrophosphohydrolase
MEADAMVLDPVQQAAPGLEAKGQPAASDAAQLVAPPAVETPSTPASKRPISVLVVVFTTAGEFLLMNRIRPQGFWQSVTGSLRPGESPRSAALRELKEETGLLGAARLIDLRQSRLFPIVKAWRARYRTGVCFNREHWFALPLAHRRIIHLNAIEHSQFLWLPIDKALDLASSWTNREAMRLLASLQQASVLAPA